MPIILPYEHCRFPGCKAKATRIPVLCVPKDGKEATREHSIESRFDIPCCPDHLPEPRDVMSDKLEKMFLEVARRTPGKPVLCFDKAFMVAESMLTDKYAKIKMARQKRGDNKPPVGIIQ